jgi:hypothetical protein
MENKTPKFQETFCSQCGRAFGAGDSGFSHCDQHADLVDIDEAGRTPCPRCEGKGWFGPVHINRGNKPHEWVEKMDCDMCNMRGTIDASQRKAIELGRQLRAKRIERGESLREGAIRLGLKASELSALETGRYGLTSWRHPFATSACLEIGFTG